LAAALALGCDLGYIGTRFIATTESMADPDYKQMLIDCNADDVLLTRAFTGLRTNMLRPSIVAAGLDPDDLPRRGGIDVAQDIAVGQPRRWRDIWSAGHSVGSVTEIVPVETLIRSIAVEFEAARRMEGPRARGRRDATDAPPAD
jgi:nitronate monooxygenase